MLTIVRKAGSSFTIGDDITVHIVAVEGRQVRVGIDAPEELSILRDDIKNKEKKNFNS